MSNFRVHNQETAPAKSAALLDGVEKAFGFVPNLSGVMAESPATLSAHLTLGKLFGQSSFSATEQQTVILAISRYHDCRYCVAAHSVIADMQNVPSDVVEAIRDDELIADRRLQVLREFATKAVAKRGWFSDDDVSDFLAAGFTKAQVLEVILAVSYKTLSNYINHVADTPLDSTFEAGVWTPKK